MFSVVSIFFSFSKQILLTCSVKYIIIRMEQEAPEGATCKYQLSSKFEFAISDTEEFIKLPVMSISKTGPAITATLDG